MNPLAWINPGLRDIFRMGVREMYAYRIWLYLGVLQVFLQLVLMRAIWSAVYGDRETVDGVPIGTMITYLTVVGMLGHIMRIDIADEIHERIDQGRVAVDMVRPVGFVRQMLALNLGQSAAIWITLIVVLPGLMVIGSLAPPDSDVLPAFLLSAVLAYTVSTLIWLLVGLSAFWLLDVSGMRAIVWVAGDFLAGALVPIWFMPGPLRAVVEWLPFQAMSFLPASIYVEQARGADIWRALAIQAAWVAALWALAAWTWRRAQRRLVVQGG